MHHRYKFYKGLKLAKISTFNPMYMNDGKIKQKVIHYTATAYNIYLATYRYVVIALFLAVGVY